MTRTAKVLSAITAAVIRNALYGGPSDRTDRTFAEYGPAEAFFVSGVDSCDDDGMELSFTYLSKSVVA